MHENAHKETEEGTEKQIQRMDVKGDAAVERAGNSS